MVVPLLPESALPEDAGADGSSSDSCGTRVTDAGAAGAAAAPAAGALGDGLASAIAGSSPLPVGSRKWRRSSGLG